MNSLRFPARFQLLSAIIILGLTARAPGKEESGAVDKLRAEHASQSRALLGVVNEIFAKQAEPMVKSYLQANDLESSQRTAQFVECLKDADDTNDTTLKPSSTAITDRLGALMKRYRDSRAKEMAKINTDFAAKALVLKKQAMQAGKLDEASQAETLVKDWTGKPDLAAKPKPKTVEDLKEYLHGTTWEVSNHKPDTEVIWILTFDKNGSFKHSVAGTAKWTAQSVTNIKLWDYDPLTFNKDYTRFKAVGAAGTYFGKLVP